MRPTQPRTITSNHTVGGGAGDSAKVEELKQQVKPFWKFFFTLSTFVHVLGNISL